MKVVVRLLALVLLFLPVSEHVWGAAQKRTPAKRTAKKRPVKKVRKAPVPKPPSVTTNGKSLEMQPARPASLQPIAGPAAAQIADAWLAKMTLRQKIAQMIIMPFYGVNPKRESDPEFQRLAGLVQDLQVGGLIIINRPVRGRIQAAEPVAMASFLNRMQALAPVPLMVGGDFERGASMRVKEATKYPHAMAYGAAADLTLTRELGAATAAEARKLGVHWIYVPAADVNNNPDNPIINTRSFGEDPVEVSKHVVAFLEGARTAPNGPVLTSVKHFPGHGDTNVDSHISMPSITASRERMDQVELMPFRAAIQANVDSVMVSHLAVPAYEPEAKPATVSRNIITGLLKERMKYDGIVVSDAMDMKGLTSMYPAGEASVRAVEAGMDILIMPTDAQAAVDGLEQAVLQKRIPEERITEAARKMLLAKASLGLDRERFVETKGLDKNLSSTQDEDRALRVARRALALLKNGDNLPLSNAKSACFFALTEREGTEQGNEWVARVKSRARGARAVELHPGLRPKEFTKATAKLSACSQIVVAAFVSVGAFRGNTSLGGTHARVLSAIEASGRPATFIALGSPYTLRVAPWATTMIATHSTVPYSERASVEAIFGEIAINAKTPVTVPGIAKRGDGLTLRPNRAR